MNEQKQKGWSYFNIGIKVLTLNMKYKLKLECQTTMYLLKGEN